MPTRNPTVLRVARLVALAMAACVDAPTTPDRPQTEVEVISGGLVEARSPKKVFTLTTATTGTGTGSISTSPSAPRYATGTLVTATATPAPGSSFTRWSGACTGTYATCTVTMNANQSITAEFATSVMYTLTLMSSGSGTGSVSAVPPGPSYPQGTTVTITATPGAGSTFSGWSGACAGSASDCVVTMDASLIVDAAFSSTSTNTTYDGSYSGTFTGTSSSTAGTLGWSGPVAFTIQNGIVTLTAPGSGSGTVSPTGQATITCSVGALADCTMSGTFTVDGSTVTGSGNYSCTWGSASGTWTAHR